MSKSRGLRMNLCDLPEDMRKQFEGYNKSNDPKPKGKIPTKTEQEFNDRYLQGKGRFEALTFRMSNGHKYTPDYFIWDGVNQFVYETKGSYRLHTYQRAKLAFDQCKIEYPMFKFIWAEKQKTGEWKIN
ncbi:MAG: hypothetical protein WC716_16520 [Chitinophagaceae bacterium]|jgi:hypothetical protein